MLRTLPSLSIVLASLLFVAGCASGPTYADLSHRIPPIPEGQGRLYFYRPSSMAAGLRPAIRVNDRVVGDATSKAWLFADFEPGSYTIKTSTLMEHSLTLELGPGQERYVVLRSSVGLLAGHVYPRLASNDEGRRALQGLAYVGPQSALLAPGDEEGEAP